MQPDAEPDYRMTLAAERTYLAYVRTGLALVAAGVAVAGALPDAGAGGYRKLLGVVLAVLGGLVFMEGRRRWRAVQAAMRRGAPLPHSSFLHLLAWALFVIALAAAVLAVVV
jgi:putative membrane protein